MKRDVLQGEYFSQYGGISGGTLQSQAIQPVNLHVLYESHAATRFPTLKLIRCLSAWAAAEKLVSGGRWSY